MAIVKVSYTRSRGAIKANLRYNMHRPGKDREKTTRQLFGWDGDLTKEEAYRMIDEAEKGTIGFRFILNFDPKKENAKKDLDLRDLTTQFMLKLRELKENKAFEYFAVEHNDHTDLPHIHAVVLFHGKVFKKDLKALHDSLGVSARAQRLRLDMVRKRSLERSIVHPSLSYRPIGMSGGKARRTREPYRRMRLPPRSCPSCGRRLSMKRVRDGQYKCFECGLKQEQSAGLSL